MKQAQRTPLIQNWILDQVARHPADVVFRTSVQFDISRQAAHSHVKKLVDAGKLIAHGNTRYRYYVKADEQLTEPGIRLSQVLELEGLYDWSNPHLSSETLILRVLESANLDDVIRVSAYFGIERVKLIAKKVSSAVAATILKRMIPNIEKGLQETPNAA